jgi:hypothetical protein
VPQEYYDAITKQTELTEEYYDWYQNTLYPWYKEQTEASNALNEKVANASLEDAQWWRDYTQEQTNQTNAIRDAYYAHWQDNYYPIEQQLISDAQNYNSDAYAEQQAQAAIGDIASSYASQRQQTALNLSQYGIDPSSGQYVGQMNALGVNQAAATAAASNSARQAAVELGWSKNLQLANLGVQYAGIVNSATSASSQTAATGSSATNSSSTTAQNAATQSLSNIQGLAQTGLSSFQTMANSWGSIANSANQNYSNQISAYSAQQQSASSSASGIGSMIGSVATTAAVAI